MVVLSTLRSRDRRMSSTAFLPLNWDTHFDRLRATYSLNYLGTVMHVLLSQWQRRQQLESCETRVTGYTLDGKDVG